jgi:hypothetical protein
MSCPSRGHQGQGNEEGDGILHLSIPEKLKPHKSPKNTYEQGRPHGCPDNIFSLSALDSVNAVSDA